MEDETATSGRAKRLRTLLERAMDVERETAARGRDREAALENQIRSLEALVRERGDALRASELERLELLEKTGGPNAFVNIKSYVPVYESCMQ